MIRHIVWWTLKPEALGHAAAENALKMKAIGEALIGKIPSLKSLEISADILPTSTMPATVVLQSSHDDAEGLRAYAQHPEHQKLIEFVKAVTATRQALDYVC